MANEPVESGVIQKDIENIGKILQKAGKPLPILRGGNGKVSALPVTEEFLAGMNARKKRLQARNLQVEIKDSDEKSSAQPDTAAVLEEGIHRSGCLNKWWNKVIIYRRGEKEISRVQCGRVFSYYILKESDGDCKISSVYNTYGEDYGREKECRNADMKETKDSISFLLILLLFGFLSAIIVFFFIKELLHAIYWENVLKSLLFFIIPGGIFGFIFVLCAVYLVRIRPFYKKKRIFSRKVSAKLLEKVPGFCLEKFLGILNSKLLRLLYADGAEEIGDIVSCDIAQFLQDHGDVVNCEFRNFWFTDMQEDGDYMYLDVVYKLTLDRDWGTIINQEEQLIHMQLARPLQGIMEADLYEDWSIVKAEVQKRKVEKQKNGK